jgi:hypothetical protein
LNWRRHCATGDNVLNTIKRGHNVGLSRSCRYRYNRCCRWLRMPSREGCDPLLESHETQTMNEKLDPRSAESAWRTATLEVQSA